jgi:hypothetical protein
VGNELTPGDILALIGRWTDFGDDEERLKRPIRLRLQQFCDSMPDATDAAGSYARPQGIIKLESLLAAVQSIVRCPLGQEYVIEQYKV